ncbi:hypothetical protein L3X38_026295 [Prunus dulcis]|uniref:Uncharacterized protein n=1 Tax=Prunus dulcis TaxID=3755 RepID=A0AAD4URN6_PRUDU|nr:hypothetical protein L3X38_026295 [Prunus dulcis]
MVTMTLWVAFPERDSGNFMNHNLSSQATLERGDENLTKVSFCTQQESLNFSSSAAARSAYFQSFECCTISVN